MTQFEDVLETILEEYARRDSEGEFDTWEETDAFVKEKAEVLLAYVKKEPVSNDFEMALAEMIDKAQTSVVEPWVIAAQWKDELIKLAKSEEPVSEDLEKACEQLAENARKHKAETSSPFFSQTDYKQGVIDGAKWQKEHLWKPADGDDLPIIDREVIALLDNGKVVFAHRPPEFWDGKDIVTGKVTRNYPKTYDKGGWNIPDVKYWLDVDLPKLED